MRKKTIAMMFFKARARAFTCAVLAAVLLATVAPPRLEAAPFAQRISFVQADGTAITIWGQGDEFYAVFETLDGYTVVFDPATQSYCYARLAADASQLLSTGVPVHTATPQSLGLPQHLRIAPEARRREVAARVARWEAATETSSRWRELKAARLAEARGEQSPPQNSTLGTKVGLCLLIDFDNDPATIAPAEIDNFCNGDAYRGFGNNGSVKTYYQDNSNGLLTYSNVVTVYVRIPNSLHPKSWYNDTTKNASDQANLLIKDALAILKALPNYTTAILPLFDALTVNNRNEAVACNVFYAGGNGGVWAKGLWPHSWSLNNVGAQELSPGGKKVFRYQVTNIGSSLELGTFCHENGHMLCGFPDIYDYDYDSVGGAGLFCLMNSGAFGGNPSQICAYLKRAAGWATTTELTLTSSLVAAVKATKGTNFNNFYRYAKPQTATEYFLVENRQKSGRDAGLPGAGVAIWHIDELGDRDNQSLTPNTQHANYEVTLVQADNRWHFEKNLNSGDAYDLYYKGNASAGYRNAFSDTNSPNAHWWDGSNSGLVLREFSASGATMNFLVGNAPVLPLIVTQPVSLTVYAGAKASFAVVAAGADPLAYQWRKAAQAIPGATTTTHNINPTQPSDAGVYSVVVSNAYGSAISSNATLVVVPTVALAEALNATSLVWSTTGDAPWFGQTNASHDGQSSAQSGPITDGQQSRLNTTVTGPGTLTFWWRVSSQSGADTLSFQAGGVTQAAVSGERDWEPRTFYLPAGTLTLEWSYAKDATGTEGLDLGWVDEVTYAAVPTPPAITDQPIGQTLLFGEPATFTVTAVGTPPLQYQWRFNGQRLAGATTSAFAIAKTRTTNSGAYSVLVSNAYGSAISAEVALGIVPIVAWGNNGFGQTTISPAATNTAAVAAGAWHSLALRKDGGLAAWGNDYDGQCDVPPDLTDAVAIAAGGYHSLAARADGTVIAWGANYYGQTGVPAGATDVVAVAAGGWHSLALRSDGRVLAWGDASWGQTSVPASLTNAVAIAAGGNHSLALRNDGTVVAWGDNYDVQGNYVGQSVAPWGLADVVAVAAGESHSLALKADGTVVAWGDNSQGQSAVPPELTGAIAIAGGGMHSLALLPGGKVVAWGNDVDGQSTVATNLLNVTAVAGGAYHSLALLGESHAAPHLANASKSRAGFRVALLTVRGRVYFLEFSAALPGTGWTIRAAVLGDGRVRTLTEPNVSGSQGFYRVREQ